MELYTRIALQDRAGGGVALDKACLNNTSQPPVDHHGPFDDPRGRISKKLKISNVFANYFSRQYIFWQKASLKFFIFILEALIALHVLDCYSEGKASIQKSST